MVEAMLGKWELESSEHLDKLLEEFGCESRRAKILSQMRAEVEITKEADEWGIWVLSSKSGEYKGVRFKIGVEFTYSLASGRTVRSTFLVHDDKLHEIGDYIGLSCESIWEIVDGRLKITTSAGEVVSTRIYVRPMADDSHKGVQPPLSVLEDKKAR